MLFIIYIALIIIWTHQAVSDYVKCFLNCGSSHTGVVWKLNVDYIASVKSCFVYFYYKFKDYCNMIVFSLIRF